MTPDSSKRDPESSSSSPSAASLAARLVEPPRPLLDEWASQIANEKHLAQSSPSQIEYEITEALQEAYLLGQAGRLVDPSPPRCLKCIPGMFVCPDCQKAARVDPSPQEPDVIEDDAITTWTPLYWASLNDDQKYEEYLRFRQRLYELKKAARVDPSSLAQTASAFLEAAEVYRVHSELWPATGPNAPSISITQRMLETREALRAALVAPTQPSENKEDED